MLISIDYVLNTLSLQQVLTTEPVHNSIWT